MSEPRMTTLEELQRRVTELERDARFFLAGVAVSAVFWIVFAVLHR